MEQQVSSSRMSSKVSWRLGLHIDPTLAEFLALDAENNRHVGARYYLPKINMDSALADFVAKIPEISQAPVRISTSVSSHLFERRTGDAPAMLVTAGFEGWPFLRQPGREEALALLPVRSSPLLSPDLVFGVSERTDINGQILEAPKEEEIQFLITKLQFSSVKTVALCFLHSQLNPQNENMVAEMLRSAGFEVACSSAEKKPANEVARWWRAFSKLYLKSTFESANSDITQSLLKKGWEQELINWVDQDPVDAVATRDRELSKFAKMHKHQGVLYVGFDSWKMISANKTKSYWTTDLGPIQIEKPETHELFIQPMMELSMTDYGVVSPNGLNLGLDPGPARWGRSLRPTVLDAILPDDFHFAMGLHTIDPGRASESLNSLSRSSKMSKELIKDSIMDLIDDQWRLLLARNTNSGTWLLAGPLVQFFGPRLQEIGFRIVTDPSMEYGSARALS